MVCVVSNVPAPATHTAVTKKVRKPRPLSAMITPPSQPQRSGSATPSKQLEVTPTTRSSALDAKLSASVPRPAARRSLSTPLGRSLSFRAPRTKDRRWSDGLASGLSTYQVKLLSHTTSYQTAHLVPARGRSDNGVVRYSLVLTLVKSCKGQGC